MTIEPTGLAIVLTESECKAVYSEIYRLFDAGGFAQASPERRERWPIIDELYNKLYDMGMT